MPIEAFGTYNKVGHKRMWARILKVLEDVNSMLKEVISWPITQDERILAKHNGALQDAFLEGS